MYDKVTEVYQSATEIQLVSNNSHNIWGICLFLFAILILLAGYNYKRKKLLVLIPALFILMELGFLGYIFFNKGIQKVPELFLLIIKFPEIYVHLFMAAVTITGSTIEILYQKGKLKNQLASLAFPTLFVGLGFLNVIHPHGGGAHDNNDALFHSVLGVFFITTGICFLLNRLLKTYQRVFLIFGCGSLMIVGIMLTQYHEPSSAYQYAFQKPISVSEYIDKGDIAVVEIDNGSANPKNIKIKKGGRVVFIFLGNQFHEISSGPHPTHSEYPPLNLDISKQGDVKTVNFPKPGLYGFHDHLYENSTKPIQGTILVTD